MGGDDEYGGAGDDGHANIADDDGCVFMIPMMVDMRDEVGNVDACC